MKLGKRLFALVVFLVSAAALAFCLAGGFGVWKLAGSVTEGVTQVFGRIEQALGNADRGMDRVEASLAAATARLEKARNEPSEVAEGPQGNNAARRVLARTVRQKVVPHISDANETLHTVAEAVVAINSMLEDIGNLPFLSATDLDLDRLTELNRRLADAGQTAGELSRLLGEQTPERDGDAAGTQLSRVEQALKAMQGSVAEYGSRIVEVRQRCDVLKAKMLSWITTTAAVISLISFWLAVSQACVLARAWTWWKHAV
jgi:uncharacterized coiled-coil protein SlyX